MKRLIYIASIFLFLLSCTSRTIYKKPENLIPKDQMIELWTAIIIADNAKTVKNGKSQRKINYMPFVYQKYKIDSTRFMESNIYYTSKIEEYEKMFQEVALRLRTIKESYDPMSADIDPTLPIWKKDSIRRSNKEKRKNQEVQSIKELSKDELKK